jgi:hypothetical protein
MSEAVFHPTVGLLRASPRTTRLSTLPRSSAHPYWRLIQQTVVDVTMFTIFPNFDPLINFIIEMISRKLYFQFWLFWSHQTSLCGFELGHAKHPGVTHGHVGIGYHVNSDGPIISFGIKNESRHADWLDPNMNRVTSLDVTHFGSKSACFSYYLTFSCN